MSEDAETANREAVIVAVVSSLRKAFGARASAVAEKQIEARRTSLWKAGL